MKDRISRMLSEYVSGVPGELSRPVESEAKRRLLDTIGVALGASREAGPLAARRYVYQYQMPLPSGCLIWGTPFRTTPEAATLANGVAARYLDFNDSCTGLETLHPSDMIAGLVAVGEWTNASGRDLLTAIAVGYEVAVALANALSVKRYGWDHVLLTAVGACCGASRLLGLTETQVEHALSITIVPHAPMYQTRTGELSMWKGFAAPSAVRQAVYACLLASLGVEGAYQPFEGERGFVRQLIGGEIPNEAALESIRLKQPPSGIVDTSIKAWPIQIYTQSAVDAALSLRRELGGPAQIERVHIATFRAAYDTVGKDPEKWRPKTRETADHSLPYLVAAALLDGKIDQDTFSIERITDPAIQRFLQEKITLREAPDLTAGYPEGIPNRLEIETSDGRTLLREVRYPAGHFRNPMPDALLREKYLALAVPVLGAEVASRLAERIGELEAVSSVRDLTGLLVLQPEG